MRGKVSLLVVAGLAATSVLAAPPASAQAPVLQDSVTATGDATLPGGGGFFSIQLQARSGPSGETPTGSASFRLGGPDGLLVSGEVSCLRVNGHVATLKFRDAAFGDIAVDLTDNAGTGLSDTMDSIPAPGDPTTCSPFPSPILLAEFTAGGVEVVDANPSPTSKDQCKNGGWRNYGTTFKNQGQCVTFVERRANPAP
jgi:hypothetical protein